MEKWKRIPNFSRYEASTMGRIRSKNYKNSGRTKVLKPSESDDGYLKTMLQNDKGGYNSWAIHKWIASAYLGEKPAGKEINHKDGNKLNNRPDNLEFCSRSENMTHAYKNNLLTCKRGSLNGMAKISEQDVKEIRFHAEKYAPRYGRKYLAEKYGISEAHIKDIVTRRRNIWPHV